MNSRPAPASLAPDAPDPGAPAILHPQDPAPFRPAAPHTMTVVLVDDEPQIVALIEGVLKSALDVHVRSFDQSEDALDYMRDGNPGDLVIVDQRLPGMSGLDLIGALREDPRFQEVPLIMLTALEDRDVRRTALRLGANDFLAKSVDPVELAVRVRNMLNLRARTLALEAANRQLEALAVTDPLTGIANRRRLLAALSDTVKLARRSGLVTSVVLFDVDRYKLVNDTFGHKTGDEVLVEICRAATHTLRSTDVLGRLGGEEFAAVLPNTPFSAAMATAERLRVAIAAASVPVTQDGTPALLSVTASFGVAEVEPDDPDGADALSRADKATYRAKGEGRNRVCGAV